MIYAVLFEDNAARAELRSRHMSDHLAFLDRNAGRIRAAGPLSDVRQDTAAGGLWLVEADALSEVEALVEADPFWPSGLRKSVRILQWRQVFAEGARKI